MVQKGKFWRVAALASFAALLAGCEKMQEEEWEPGEPAAVSIDEQGVVTEYLSEELDQPYYSYDELKAMLDSEVSAYNSRYGEGSVSVVSAGQEGKQANLVITYASGEDYARFNNIEFYYGSMINAQLAGYLFDVSYKEVSDGVVEREGVDGGEVLKHMADQVVVVRAPLEVHVPGDVIFTSSNASVIRPDVVLAQEEEEDPDGSKLSEEEKEALARVYIVFTEREE